MAEQTKNLCAQIPIALHEKVRSRQQESGKTLNEYVTWLITKFYETEKGRINMDNTRTLAVQLDAELFDRLDEYLKRRRLKKRAFITELITYIGMDVHTTNYTLCCCIPIGKGLKAFGKIIELKEGAEIHSL